MSNEVKPGSQTKSDLIRGKLDQLEESSLQIKKKSFLICNPCPEDKNKENEIRASIFSEELYQTIFNIQQNLDDALAALNAFI